PLGVKRSSGSLVRFPTTVMTVSPAIECSLKRGSCSALLGVRAEDLRAQNGLVESELTIEFLGRCRLGVDIDHDVVALGLLLDLVRAATTSPDIHVVDGAVLSRDNLDQVVHCVSQRPLFEVVIKNEHELVLTHMSPTSSGLCGHGRSMAGGNMHARSDSVPVTNWEQTSLV